MARSRIAPKRTKGIPAIQFGDGRIECVAPVKTKKGHYGILLECISPTKIGTDVPHKLHPKDAPKLLLDFSNVKSAVVILRCITEVIQAFCKFPARKKPRPASGK